MAKIIYTLLLPLTLSGCIWNNVKTNVQEVKVPILYCPAPTHHLRPELPIQHMTPKQLASDGEVVKRYKATVVVLLGYASILEQELDKYNDTSASYKQMKNDVLEKIKKGKIDPNAEIGK